MPVPKRKTSKRRRDQRQSTKFIRPQAITSCKQCNEPTLPHQVCTECGYYKGRKVLTTKNDRGLQRDQIRAAAAQKAAAKNSQDHSHNDGHDHSAHE
ncbi:MAG: 50S ribosomal protein L32 [Candidatus Babeliaceae bacterium]|nr:50S ribosomal protein L32 [Candidatus Babeliaceae bacterium]